MITLHPHKWLHLKQGTTKLLQAMLLWPLEGTAERPAQKDRDLVTWGLQGLRQAQSVEEPPRAIRIAICTSLCYTQRDQNLSLSFHTFLAHSLWPWGHTATKSNELYYLQNDLPLKKAEQEEGKVLLWLEGKKELSGNKSFQHLKSFHLKVGESCVLDGFCLE